MAKLPLKEVEKGVYTLKEPSSRPIVKLERPSDRKI
jgi:hypothetical protein